MVGLVITGRGAAGAEARLVRFFLRVCASPSTRQKLTIRQKSHEQLDVTTNPARHLWCSFFEAGS